MLLCIEKLKTVNHNRHVAGLDVQDRKIGLDIVVVQLRRRLKKHEAHALELIG